MLLQSGAHLGSYEILSSLGAGGMGEVYRARDTTLNRDVAIKVVPDIFSADPDRRARFEREAQLLASLNHTNIAHIYGLERQEGQERPLSFIVMELVEGEELAQRIARGPMPLDETLPIAAQLAEALEAAHGQGIVHRDLKPANIKFKPDGTVKVLDFGLAKALDPAASTTNLSMSPTLSVHATEAGVILGTAAYMSPEQARGKPVDKRADIWAFGVVLYEMITGRKPFAGDDAGEVLAAVIKDEPSWQDVPAKLRRLLQRCLEKDPKKRLRDISGVGLLLEEPAAPAQARTSRLAWSAAGTLAVVAIVALWAPWHRTRTSARALVRLDVDLGPEVSLDPGSPQGAGVIISPDGHRLVWASRGRLFTRRLDQPKALELAGTQGASSAFFSPDGQWVGFFAGGKLRKVSVEGGAALTLCDAPQGRGGTWGEDGRIVASLNGNTLSTISDSGGLPAPLTELSQGDPQHRWPQILPGERAVLFTARSSSPLWDEASIDVVSLVDRRRKTLQRGGMFGRYVATGNGDGYLVYVNKSTLYAAPFDVSRLEIRGAPVVVLEDVAYNNVNGAAQFDLSRTGTVVYRSLAAGTLVSLQWLDANGNTQALPAKPAVYLYPRLSHDGKLLAVAIAGAGGQDIWIYDWQRDAMSRVTFGGTAYANQVWSPDGRFIVFRGGGGMFWTRADGAGAPQRLTQSQNPQDPGSFSPDGKRLAFTEFPMSGGDIWTVPIEHDGSALKAGKPEPFLQTPASEMFPAFSPDGRWIAYRTFESGISQIQLRAFPDKGGKSLISNNGGVVPVWSPNGRELFYRTEDQHIMVVSYTVKGDVFTGDKPRVWSAKAMAESSTQNPQNLDIAPDGKRFVTLMPVDAPANQQTQNRVVFLENFADELRRRVGAAK